MSYKYIRVDSNNDTIELLSLVRISGTKKLVIQIETYNKWQNINDRNFIGLYDLDGDHIQINNKSWELVADSEISLEEVENIFQKWEIGDSTIERLIE